MIYGLSAALFGEITVKNGRVEQGNFDTYPVVRFKDAPKTEVYISPTPRQEMGRRRRARRDHDPARGDERDLRRDRETPALAADPQAGSERRGVDDIRMVQRPDFIRPPSP